MGSIPVANALWDRVLSCPSLPTLPAAAIEVLELTRDPNVTIAKLARIVQNDPALAAKVLKTVNSSFYGLSQPCSKVDRALGLLGINAVKSIVLGFSLIDATSRGAGGLDMEEYWRRAIYAAAGARHVALTSKSADPDETFTAALFQDIGMLASISALGDQYRKVVESCRGEHSVLPDKERHSLGFTHAEAGAALARKWKLPAAYESAIAHHLDPDAAPPEHAGLARMTALGGLIAETLANPEAPGQATARLLMCASQWMNIPAEELETLLSEIADSAAALAKLFEKNLGTPPDVRAMLAEASERLVETQLSAQREAAAEKEALERSALTDGLTGAWNRRSFDAALSEAWEGRGSRAVAVLFVDADKFKSINDTHGHAAGDAVLVELARRISGVAMGRGRLYRYGGEEFVVLGALGVKEAASLAEAVRRAVEAEPILAGAAGPLRVTVSVGVASQEAGASAYASAESLLKTADEGVYRAKAAGRNRVVCADVGGTFAGFPAPPAASASRGASAVTPAAAAPTPTPTPTTPHTTHTAHTAPTAPTATPAKTTGTRRVLLVEDDPLTAKLLTAGLQRIVNTEVVWVSTVDAAARALASEPSPNVALVDYHLGEQTALDVLSAGRGRGTPMVVMSADARPAVVECCKQAGAAMVVDKSDLATDMAKRLSAVVAVARAA